MPTKKKVRRKKIRKDPRAPHIVALQKNLKEVERLVSIHADISGSGPGRKRNVQVLNKSAIILLLACWEAYIEDLAENVFNILLEHASEPTVFPDHVLAIAAKEVKKGDAARLWSLSGEGWKVELKEHKQKILTKYIVRGSFNTPSSSNINTLFSELVGLTSISRQWYWPGMSNSKVDAKLTELIELRGSIAHRVEASRIIYKKDVEDFRKFILRLAVISNNRSVVMLKDRTNHKSWRKYKLGKTK